MMAQKLPMLKQGLKTINFEFIRTHALFQLSFVQFRLCGNSRASSLFDVNAKKQTDTGDEFRPYAFVQDLRWR